MTHSFKKVALAVAIGFTATGAFAQEPAAVLNTYAEIAQANYSDALADAIKLQEAIKRFSDNPTEESLQAAKDAWLQSRESYGETEIFRLSAGPIDAEEGWVADAYGALEGQINAWPLDENMIDYTIDADGQKTTGNIIDSTGEFTPGGEEPEAVNVDEINVEVITALNENGGEANVASGYHAIEFLLWGQDQDYNNFIEDTITNGAMVAGQRPLTDFTEDKFAERRLAYLNAAADKLVADVELVSSAWAGEVDGNKGLYRAALLGQLDGADADKNIASDEALKNIFIGMGMFIKSELANERIAVAVLTPSEEDEHSCFSDNTHRDIAQNFQGFKNILMGEYLNDKVGAAPFDALSEEDQKAVTALVDDIDARIATINDLAINSMHFDYQIHPENEDSVNNVVALKNQLRKLGDKMVTVGAAFDVSLNEDDVTDAEETQI
ncbi:imelysin family protein [Suttonella sp. R2A3]|uniref:imelysin family protein n=1 Tax=Suttonella sp. R2A3 TaxID=2908648 RepID=UPI0038FCEE8C